MFTAYLSQLPSFLQDYHLAPDSQDRSFWERDEEGLGELILCDANALPKEPLPPLLASDYLAFSKTGSRIRYENPYFARRTRLGTLALAYCLKPDEQLRQSIIDCIWAICEESTWCLPAHNSYIRDTPQLPLAQVDRPVIDLFSAETAATLAQVYALLKHALDEETPLIAQRIEKEIERRIHKPYLDEHFWWMGKGGEPMNNWTVWCTQNVLLCTFLLPTCQTFRHQVAEKALSSLDFFLKDYGDDGCCSEGAQYYRHAGLCLYLCIDILNQVGSDVLKPVYQEPKIRNIASFIRHIHAQGPYYFNFSDCSALAGPCTVRELLFARAIDDAELEAFALHSAQLRPKSERHLPQEINLTYRLLELMNHHSLETEAALPSQCDHSYPSVGIFTSHDKHFALAVKAGGNDDSHNHNDTGSITLYKDGSPILIDIGVETYTKQTFSTQRYSIWTMRSVYHNLSNFPPHEQQAGRKYCSTVLEKTEGQERIISMELAGCYPGDIGLHSYRRTVTHHKGRDIVIKEQVEGICVPILSLMTVEQPLVEEKLIHLGKDVLIRFSEELCSVEVETIPITDARLLAVWPKQVYRILASYDHHLEITIT